jgi:thiamine pyrophosphate-dependent acetolactate synthase large subunit-like protein
VTTGARAVAQTLRQAGVEVAFGLPGVHNMAMWPAFEAEGIRIVGSRHEQGCAYAADGYARATGKLGVALVTTGPGAANTLGAVGEAWASKSPVLVIATDIPSSQRVAGVYKGVLHECTDQAGMFAPVTKVQTRDLAEAIRSTTSGVYGPAYFEIPTDLLRSDHEPTVIGGDVGRFDVAPPTTLPSVALGERPLMWVGGGAKHAGSQIDALARRIGAPVITTYSARGVLPADHPHLVPAPPHEPQVIELVRQAGCTIVIGSDLDAMNTMAWKLPLPSPRIAINLDQVDATKNYEMNHVLTMDTADLDAWTRSLPLGDPWFDDLAALGKEVRDDLRVDPDTAESIEFLERTECALHAHADPFVFADMCIAGYWLAGHLAVHRTRGLHYPMGWGTLGWAFPASIGAAADGQPSVAFMGDGGMLFAIGELATVAQERLPLTVVVVDDGGYGMLRYPRDDAPGCELSPVDFVAVANGFGIEAESVAGVGPEYEAALAHSLTADAPRLLHVHARLYPPRTTSPRWPMR